MSLLAVRDYRLSFETFDGELHVLDGIDLEVQPGETVGIVGETGCGKSVLAKSLLGLLPSPPARIRSGAITFGGRDLTKLEDRGWRDVRGVEIAMIFQDPMTFLNPVFTIGQQLMDVIRAHDRVQPAAARHGRAAVRARALQLLEQVRLPDAEAQLDRYPHQLSGGMRQRVLIAMALAGRPKLLVADEPTTALDVTIQAQILRLIRDLVDELGLAVLLISHDLGVISQVCARTVVMYAGTIVEDAPTAELLRSPRHPYTQGLLAALPTLRGARTTLQGIPGSLPDLLHPPAGCRYQERCPWRIERCLHEKPLLGRLAPGHRAACHVAARLAAEAA